jgi:hypothetical protein
MEFEPNIRNAFKIWFLEDLRQRRYSDEENPYDTAEQIAFRIRQILIHKGAAETHLHESRIDADMARSVARELLEEGRIQRRQSEKGGFLRRHVINEYSLTPLGLADIKSFSDIPHAQVEKSGNIIVQNVESMPVHGNAYIDEVHAIVTSDSDLRMVVNDVRQMHLKTNEEMQSKLEELIAENGALKARIKSRGWKIIDFAKNLAKIIAVVAG